MGETRKRKCTRRASPRGASRLFSSRYSALRLAPGVPFSASQRALSASSSASRGCDDEVGVLEAPDLLHFLGGEGGLGRAATPEDVDLLDGALRQRFERVRRDVGCRQPLGALRQHARDVHRHVAVADHGHPLGGARAGTRVLDSRGGRCTSRRTRSRSRRRAGPRPGSPCGGGSRCRPRSRPGRSCDAARRARGRGPPSRCRRSGARRAAPACRRRGSPP